MTSSAPQRSLPVRLIVDAVVQRQPFEIVLGAQIQRSGSFVSQGSYRCQRLFLAGLTLSANSQCCLSSWLDYELSGLSAAASREQCAEALRCAWSGFRAQTYTLEAELY